MPLVQPVRRIVRRVASLQSSCSQPSAAATALSAHHAKSFRRASLLYQLLVGTLLLGSFSLFFVLRTSCLGRPVQPTALFRLLCPRPAATTSHHLARTPSAAAAAAAAAGHTPHHHHPLPPPTWQELTRVASHWRLPPPLTNPFSLSPLPAHPIDEEDDNNDWARPLAFAALGIPFQPTHSTLHSSPLNHHPFPLPHPYPVHDDQPSSLTSHAAAPSSSSSSSSSSSAHRAPEQQPPVVQLFVFTQGLALANHGYELDVVACRVGTDVYPVAYAFSGVYGCRIPRLLLDGEPVSVVIEETALLVQILTGYLFLKGRNATAIKPTDLQRLRNSRRNSFTFHSPALEQLGRSSLLLVASSVVWNNPSMMEPPLPTNAVEARYELCMMTQEKLFPELLPSWVEYHLRIGVDMIYVYDNTASSNLTAMLQHTPSGVPIEIVPWPRPKSQIQAHNHFLLLAQRRCEWVMLIDVDEYVVAGAADLLDKSAAGDRLKTYLARRREEGFSSVKMSEIRMESSGHHYQPKGPIQEEFIHRSGNQKFLLGKSALWTNGILPNSYVHSAALMDGHNRYTPSEEVVMEPYRLQQGELYVIHYFHRSWEEYLRKAKSHRNSVMVVDWTVTMNSDRWELERPWKDYLNMTAHHDFTLFRDYWRLVMAQGQAKKYPNQTLVLVGNDLRCVVRASKGRSFLHAPVSCNKTTRTTPWPAANSSVIGVDRSSKRSV